MKSLFVPFPNLGLHSSPWVPPFSKTITSIQSLNSHFYWAEFQIFLLLLSFCPNSCFHHFLLWLLQKTNWFSDYHFGKVSFLKFDKKIYSFTEMSQSSPSTPLPIRLISFLSEIITINCLLFIFPDAHVHSFFLSFYLFLKFLLTHSKACYIYCSVTCSFHLVCHGNLSN